MTAKKKKPAITPPPEEAAILDFLNGTEATTTEISITGVLVEEESAIKKASKKPKKEIELLNPSKLDGKLKSLSKEGLVDVWGQLDNFSIIVKWKIARLLKDKFKSTKAHGAFLEKLRNDKPDHALCLVTQPTLNRYATAAKFCEDFNIEDAQAISIGPTIVYELAKPANKKTVTQAFLEENVFNQTLTVESVKQLFNPKEESTETLAEIKKEPAASKIAALSAFDEETLNIVMGNEPVRVNLTGISDLHLILELSGRDASELVDKEKLSEILGFVKRYKLTSELLIELFELCIESLRPEQE
jgi:hypothetical protein